MTLHHRSRHGRPAFTLIEMLVVIAIIAILISLLMAAIFPVLLRANETDVRHDISQLDSALQTWQATYKVRFAPPSQLFLSNSYADYSGNSTAVPSAVRQQSLRYLSLIWPRLNWNNANPPIDWSGGVQPGVPAGGVLLQGDQCLVFFLGGLPTVDANNNLGVMGFSTNPQNPTVLAGDHIPPQFEFQSARLYTRGCINAAGQQVAAPFMSYKDKWGTNQPYLFFSSGMRRNGYVDFVATNPPNSITVTYASGATATISPYYTGVANNVTQYANPNTWQIISAGRDGQFGPGGQWNPPAVPAAEADDQANFTDTLLGVGQ